MKFVELPAGWQCHPEHILKHNPPQSEAEHRIWSVLCGKAVRDQQEEVSAEVGFLVQETGLPEAEILEVLQRWQEAGGAFPKTEGCRLLSCGLLTNRGEGFCDLFRSGLRPQQQR